MGSLRQKSYSQNVLLDTSLSQIINVCILSSSCVLTIWINYCSNICIDHFQAVTDDDAGSDHFEDAYDNSGGGDDDEDFEKEIKQLISDAGVEIGGSSKATKAKSPRASTRKRKSEVSF